LPFPNIILPSAPCFIMNFGKEYDIFKNLKNDPIKISPWYVIRNSPSYLVMLQTSLQLVVMNCDTNSNDVTIIIKGMNVANVRITFHQYELCPLEMRKINYSIMIIANFKKNQIKKNRLDKGFSLNII
jgi:hypothetical protein